MAEGGRLSLYVFVLVLNLVFPVFSYTFTTFGSEAQEFEASLDADTLTMAGINLVDAETEVMTYDGAWMIFGDLNVTFRARFGSDIRNPRLTIVGDGIGVQKQSPVSLFGNDWAIVYRPDIKSVQTNQWLKLIANETIVQDYDATYNWSRFILETGHQVFITPNLDHGNVTRAVYVDGVLNMTIGRTFEEDTHFNFWKFLTWYTSLLIGAQSWGLPSMFSWIIRILGAMSILSVVMLTKELTRV
jgi:hypothetical protein